MMPRLYRAAAGDVRLLVFRWGSLLVELSYGDGLAVVVGWDR